MLGRLPGIREWFERFLSNLREGFLMSEEPLPFLAKLPVISGMVKRDIAEAVKNAEVQRQRLRNVDLLHQPLIQDVETFRPSGRQAIAATVTLLNPEGRVVITRIRMPFGTQFDPADFWRRVTSSVYDDMFPGDIKATTKTKNSVISIDWYVDSYVKI